MITGVEIQPDQLLVVTRMTTKSDPDYIADKLRWESGWCHYTPEGKPACSGAKPLKIRVQRGEETHQVIATYADLADAEMGVRCAESILSGQQYTRRKLRSRRWAIHNRKQLESRKAKLQREVRSILAKLDKAQDKLRKVEDHLSGLDYTELADGIPFYAFIEWRDLTDSNLTMRWNTFRKGKNPVGYVFCSSDRRHNSRDVTRDEAKGLFADIIRRRAGM